MKLYKQLDRYLNDQEFKIMYFNDKVDINNYDEILDFTSKEVDIKYEDNMVSILGKNLVVTKMLDDEVLITGKIEKIQFKET